MKIKQQKFAAALAAGNESKSKLINIYGSERCLQIDLIFVIKFLTSIVAPDGIGGSIF